MRILIRPRLPVLALLLLAPTIPELLTGSTPVSELYFHPAGFLVGFALDLGLYGSGALLIREFVATYRKGWASVLLLGGAYGIAEEGFEVHTFFQTSGPPVGALGSYGHLWGVNWLWALGLMIFHATYSIALPILLTQLWFPAAKNARWFDRGALTLVAAIFVVNVAGFGYVVGHGPSPAAFAFFLALAAALVALAAWAPGDLLQPRSGPRRIGRLGLVLAGTLSFDGWAVVLILSTRPGVPAVAAASALVVFNLAALAIVRYRVGTVGLERSKYHFAVGMMAILFLWDVPVEFSVPGILVVAAVFAYLLYRLGRTLDRREATGAPAGAGRPPA